MNAYSGTLKVSVYIETDGNPDEKLNDLLDLLGAVDTSHIGVSWDDCEWSLSPES